jgi:tRNA-splicing ligase RtcB
MSGIWQGKLEKIDDFKWRIPKSYKPGMRVDGIIYADEKMISQIKQDQAPEQVANVAHLPGIVKYSLAMPDIHWGYGFCIGGVAATDPDKGGVISPGGVGYDINCLHKDAEILSHLGYRLKISDFKDIFHREVITCIDFNKNCVAKTNIKRFIKFQSQRKIYRMRTYSGEEIIATEDHPFWTPQGMRELRYLKPGDNVAIYPFKGVEYENPKNEVLISENDIKNEFIKLRLINKGNALQQVIHQLKKRDLLPLKYNSWQLPYLLKIMGYIYGDGTLYFVNKSGKGTIFFYGEKEDLKEIRNDILKIGYRCSLYKRWRNHHIKTKYNEYNFTRIENCCKVSSTSLALLLVALEIPIGNKADQSFNLPKWIKKIPLWQKRLFLSSLLGAELSSPKSFTSHGYNLYAPIFSMNKKEDYVENGFKFLKEISVLLREFGVKTNKISRSLDYISKDNRISYRLRLILSNKPASMLNLYQKVGFEYNCKRKFLANVAVQYLKIKNLIVSKRKNIENFAQILRKEKELSAKRIYDLIEDKKYINFRFIERSIYEKRKTAPRISQNSLEFIEFLNYVTKGLGKSGMVWDEIISKEEIKYDDYVYDFTVKHKDHNFIANSFVVSNCGVRLLKTNLVYDDIKDKIKDIVHALYIIVPAGVGSKGEIRVSHEEEKKLMIKGARWAVEKGYGVKQDLEHCEEKGEIKGANPDKVSQRAFERGKAQAGTLGSGNHFLEVQVVDQIYDSEIANKLRIYLSSITLMIHTGSRGFGYQICDDYLRIMSQAVQKYGIKLPDRQLACAPVSSPEAQNYIKAMRCAANYAWANRQCITYLVRKAFEKVFNKNWESLGLDLIYDVCHNIAKFEKHKVNGEERTLCVHRKGATRAFPPNHPDLPEDYREIGQPVIIPGDMGTNSYLLVGTEKAMEETFGSTCHGAGRVMSRSKAVKQGRGRSIARELEKQGVIVMATGRETLSEEMPEAYKDVNDVVKVVVGARISKRICRMRPLGVVKG